MNLSPEDLRNAWNVNCGDLPKCASLEIRQRFERAKLRVEETPDLPRWVAAIKRIAESHFCTGRVPTKESPGGFTATFDWLVRQETLMLIEEGHFDNWEKVPPETQSPADLSWQLGERPSSWKPSDEAFLRTQVQGVMAGIWEKFHRKPYRVSEDDVAWMDRGGDHPWASPEQVASATSYVIQARNKGTLPSKLKEVS